jgi:hypothetical protein
LKRPRRSLHQNLEALATATTEQYTGLQQGAAHHDNHCPHSRRPGLEIDINRYEDLI